MDLRELADAPRTDPPLQHQALHQQPTPSRVSWREAAPTRSGHDHRLTDGQLGGHLTDTLGPLAGQRSVRSRGRSRATIRDHANDDQQDTEDVHEPERCSLNAFDQFVSTPPASCPENNPTSANAEVSVSARRLRLGAWR
jgi:hypothetical protein